jgi:hypothetical protein
MKMAWPMVRKIAWPRVWLKRSRERAMEVSALGVMFWTAMRGYTQMLL